LLRLEPSPLCRQFSETPVLKEAVLAKALIKKDPSFRRGLKYIFYKQKFIFSF